MAESAEISRMREKYQGKSAQTGSPDRGTRIPVLKNLLARFKKPAKTDFSKPETNGGIVSGKSIEESARKVSERISQFESKRFSSLASEFSIAGAASYGGRICMVEVSDTGFPDTGRFEETLDHGLPKTEPIHPDRFLGGSLSATSEPGLYRYSLSYDAIVYKDRRSPNGSYMPESRRQKREYFIAAQDIKPVLEAFDDRSFREELESGLRPVKRTGWEIRNFAIEAARSVASQRELDSLKASRDEERRSKEARRGWAEERREKDERLEKITRSSEWRARGRAGD